MSDVLESLMPPRTKKLLKELKEWCGVRGYGAKAEVARFVGVKRQAISDWFAEPQRQEPTGEQVLAVIEFLRTRK